MMTSTHNIYTYTNLRHSVPLDFLKSTNFKLKCQFGYVFVAHECDNFSHKKQYWFLSGFAII